MAMRVDVEVRGCGMGPAMAGTSLRSAIDNGHSHTLSGIKESLFSCPFVAVRGRQGGRGSVGARQAERVCGGVHGSRGTGGGKGADG